MAWGFKRRIKIAPGLHVNIGKKGVSARVGVRGAGVTVGTSGTRASASIPGTGLSYGKKLSGGAPPQQTDADLIPQRAAPRKRSKAYYLLIILIGAATGIALVELF